MRSIAFFPVPLLLAFTPACDPGPEPPDLFQARDAAASAPPGDTSLTEALAIAEAEVPGATVIEAEWHAQGTVSYWDIELYLDGVEHEVYVSTDDGTVLEIDSDVLEPDDAAEAQAEAALVLASVGWPTLIVTAEAAVSGTAFELDVEADEGLLEIDVAADQVWEVELDTAGNVVSKSTGDSDDSSSYDDDDDD